MKVTINAVKEEVTLEKLPVGAAFIILPKPSAVRIKTTDNTYIILNEDYIDTYTIGAGSGFSKYQKVSRVKLNSIDVTTV